MSSLPLSRRTRFIIVATTLSVVYIGAVQFLAWFIQEYPQSPWRLAAAGVPIAAMASVLVYTMGSLRSLDEMQARMHLEALAFAFLGTLFLGFGYAFIAYATDFQVSMNLIVPVMVLMWTVGMLRSVWKYRG